MIAPKLKIQYDLNLSPAERLRNYGIRKAIRIAVNRAAARMKAIVAGHAEKSRRLGNLIKSLRIKVKVYRNESYVAIVGPNRNFKRSGAKITRGRKTRVPFKRGLRHTIRPGRYAHLVERGAKHHRAQPFIQPSIPDAVPTFRAEVVREIKLELAKIGIR